MARFYRFCLFLLLPLLLAPDSHARDIESNVVTTDISEARLISSVDGLAPGADFEIVLAISLTEGWHTYWKNPGDSGIPVTIKFELPEGFSAGEMRWPTPEIIDTAGIINYGYSGGVNLSTPIKTPQDVVGDYSSYTIKAKANWLVCKDICIPESGEFTIEIPAAASMDKVAINPVSIIEPLTSESEEPIAANYIREGDTIQITVPQKEFSEGEKPIRFFPLTDGIIKNGEPTSVELSSNVFTLTYPAGTVKENKDLEGVLDTESGNHYIGYSLIAKPATTSPSAHTPSSAEAENDVSDLSFLTVLGLALLGGLILNVMPCVLPVLSLKILALTKKRDLARQDVMKHGIAYTAGVIACFFAVAGVLIALKLSGEAIGWGFQLQSPEFVIAMAVVMLLVALNLLGTFELPVLFGTRGAKLTAQDSPVGSFFTGTLTALVATPCTAPFMAPAIGFALTQPPLQALVIFGALGFGLALPFLLICLYPPLMKILPKPGAWMQSFKEFLAFPMLATLIWLLWVLNLQVGAIGLVHALGVLLMATFILWLLKRKDNLLRSFSLVASCFAIFWLVMTLPTKPPSFVSSENYSAAKLEELRSAGKPVFVNATAAWCITCKVNELSTLSTREIHDYFKENGISYMVADWTNRDEEISKLLASFERQGVPLYIYYPPNGAQPKLLPQILTPSLVIETIMPPK